MFKYVVMTAVAASFLMFTGDVSAESAASSVHGKRVCWKDGAVSSYKRDGTYSYSSNGSVDNGHYTADPFDRDAVIVKFPSGHVRSDHFSFIKGLDGKIAITINTPHGQFAGDFCPEKTG